MLKSAYWPWMRCRLKRFSIFSLAGHFVQLSGTILAISVEGHPKNISVTHFDIGLLAFEEMSFYVLFRSCDHFAQLSGTILAIVVEGYPRNAPVQLF